MSAPEPDPEKPPIDSTFRNGTITAFGVTVSFSLGFLSQWASAPGVWHSYDTVPALVIFLGVVLQIRALSLLLPIEGLQHRIYEKATRTYMAGLTLTGLGVFSAVSADAITALFK